MHRMIAITVSIPCNGTVIPSGGDRESVAYEPRPIIVRLSPFPSYFVFEFSSSRPRQEMAEGECRARERERERQETLIKSKNRAFIRLCLTTVVTHYFSPH